VTVVGLAVLLAPDVGALVSGTVVPALPEGSLLYAIAVIGGVGGTFTLASYTYWVRERGWRRPSWIPTMRADLGAGYFATGLFMVAMLVVGAELLFASGESIGEEAGLVALSDPIEQRFGAVASWLFLLGFWSATTSSILGAWNGGAYLFADFMRTLRRVPDERSEEYLSEKSVFFRGFVVWITFPPMLLLAFDEPVTPVIVYAALGALFMPFLAVTLLWLLNSRRVADEYRNGPWSTSCWASRCWFIVVGVQEVVGTL
jgi:Mn2+/Fe2+ NRAMP family transporter